MTVDCKERYVSKIYFAQLRFQHKGSKDPANWTLFNAPINGNNDPVFNIG